VARNLANIGLDMGHEAVGVHTGATAGNAVYFGPWPHAKAPVIRPTHWPGLSACWLEAGNHNKQVVGGGAVLFMFLLFRPRIHKSTFFPQFMLT